MISTRHRGGDPQLISWSLGPLDQNVGQEIWRESPAKRGNKQVPSVTMRDLIHGKIESKKEQMV